MSGFTGEEEVFKVDYVKEGGNIRRKHSYALPSRPKVGVLPFSVLDFVDGHIVGVEHMARRVAVCSEKSEVTADKFDDLECDSDHLIGSGIDGTLIIRTDFQEASWVKMSPFQVVQSCSGIPNVLLFAKNVGDKIVCDMSFNDFDDTDHYLSCLSRKDLSISWKYLQTYHGELWFAVTDDFVFLLTGNGELTKLSMSSGKELWKKSRSELVQDVFNGEPTKGGCVDEPIIYRDTIVFFFQRGQMVGLSIKDGALRWKTTIERVNRYSGTPDGKIHVVGKDRQWALYRLCAETGAIENEQIITGDAMERLKASGYSVNHQVVTSTHVLVAWVDIGKSMVTAINIETGHMDWSLLGNL